MVLSDGVFKLDQKGFETSRLRLLAISFRARIRLLGCPWFIESSGTVFVLSKFHGYLTLAPDTRARITWAPVPAHLLYRTLPKVWVQFEFLVCHHVDGTARSRQ